MPQLPREIRVRLADARSHYRALVLALEQISAADYEQALKTREAEALTQRAYPLERPFEILDNYVVELARAGLDLAGKDSTGSASVILKRLRAAGVISDARRTKLRDVHDRRNELQHEYPDARAALVYEARRSSSRSCPASSGTTRSGCASSASSSCDRDRVDRMYGPQ